MLLHLRQFGDYICSPSGLKIPLKTSILFIFKCAGVEPWIFNFLVYFYFTQQNLREISCCSSLSMGKKEVYLSSYRWIFILTFGSFLRFCRFFATQDFLWFLRLIIRPLIYSFSGVFVFYGDLLWRVAEILESGYSVRIRFDKLGWKSYRCLKL